mmetsp:Transcript_13601/g.21533  ORF Transcript_13601/g.21533 Transcript_13601/m.21533 type:complete len:291 (-) Transcript_13601:176-1048(-)
MRDVLVALNRDHEQMALSCRHGLVQVKCIIGNSMCNTRVDHSIGRLERRGGKVSPELLSARVVGDERRLRFDAPCGQLFHFSNHPQIGGRALDHPQAASHDSRVRHAVHLGPVRADGQNVERRRVLNHCTRARRHVVLQVNGPEDVNRRQKGQQQHVHLVWQRRLARQRQHLRHLKPQQKRLAAGSVKPQLALVHTTLCGSIDGAFEHVHASCLPVQDLEGATSARETKHCVKSVIAPEHLPRCRGLDAEPRRCPLDIDRTAHCSCSCLCLVGRVCQHQLLRVWAAVTRA